MIAGLVCLVCGIISGFTAGIVAADVFWRSRVASLARTGEPFVVGDGVYWMRTTEPTDRSGKELGQP